MESEIIGGVAWKEWVTLQRKHGKVEKMHSQGEKGKIFQALYFRDNPEKHFNSLI